MMINFNKKGQQMTVAKLVGIIIGLVILVWAISFIYKGGELGSKGIDAGFLRTCTEEIHSGEGSYWKQRNGDMCPCDIDSAIRKDNLDFEKYDDEYLGKYLVVKDEIYSSGEKLGETAFKKSFLKDFDPATTPFRISERDVVYMSALIEGNVPENTEFSSDLRTQAVAKGKEDILCSKGTPCKDVAEFRSTWFKPKSEECKTSNEDPECLEEYDRKCKK